MGESRTTSSGSRPIAKGTVKIGVAQMVAVAAGLVTQLYLARALEPRLYGVLAVVTSIIVWWETVGRSLLEMATTRFVAQADQEWGPVAGAALRTTGVWSLLLLISFAVTAPLMARALQDGSLTPYLWLFGLDLALYPLYTTFLRILNGRKLYGLRARAEICYWAGKAGLMCGLVALGCSVPGAILGSIGASAIGLVCAWRWSGVGKPQGSFPARKLISFGLPLMGIAVLLQITRNMDLWCVQALLPDEQAPGYYGAARYLYQLLSNLPFAVCGAMFPALTQALSGGNVQMRQELIEQSFRFVLILLLPAIALVGCSAREVVTLVFSAPYVAAAAPAFLLAVAALLFALRNVGNSVLVAAGKPGTCLLALAPTVPLNIALNVWGVPRYGLIGAAAATVLTGAFAAGIMLVLVWREFRVLFAPTMLVKISVAAGIVYAVGLCWPDQGVLVVLKLAGLSGLYLLLLIALGELHKRDFEPLMFWRGGMARGTPNELRG